MTEGEAKFGGFAAVTLLFGFAIYQNADAIKEVLLYAVVGVVALGLLIYGCTKLKEVAQYVAAPKEGPIQIDLRVEEAGRQKFRLHYKAQFSQRDITALKNSGLALNVLFEYPDPRWPDDGPPAQLRNIHLLEPGRVVFKSLHALEAAKAELLEGLHALRTRLDAYEELPQNTRESHTI